MEQLPIDSTTVNKGLDIISESTEETRKELDKTTAKGINKLAQLFWASPLGIKADVYIQERPYKMQQALEEMKQKYNKNIPVEYQVEPTSYIALKGANELNYCLDEEHLKEMFENILLSDMDSRKKANVKPAYIEMVKQLSKEDANTLVFFKQAKIENEPIMKIKYNFQTGGFAYSSNNIVLITKNTYEILDSIIIDNLLRLKIIEINFMEYKNDESIYNSIFEQIKTRNEFQTLPPNVQSLDFSKGLLKVTNLGKNFIDICLS